MTYTAPTKLPVDLKFFQWSLPTAAKPTLSAPLSAAATTIYWTYAPKDYAGAVITDPFVAGIERADGYVENVYCPNGADGAGGLSSTGVIRGVRLEGLDLTTGDSTLAVTHLRGEKVFCNITGVYEAIVQGVLSGDLATGGAGFTIGTEPGASGEITTIYRTTTAGVKKGVFRWGSNFAQFSNDGETWTNCSDVSASVLFKNSAADTTPGYNEDKNIAGDGIARTQNNPGGNENSEWSVNASDLVSGDFGLEVSGNDFRVKPATDPGLEFSTGLRVKVKAGGGITRDSDGLSITNSPLFDLTSGEAIDGSTTPQAICQGSESHIGELTVHLDGVGGEWNLDVASLASLTLRSAANDIWRAQSFTLTHTGATEIALDELYLFMSKTGSPSGTLTVEIQEDNGGVPSGTAITNGTSGAVSAAGINAAYTFQVFSWSTDPVLTSGQKYWAVVKPTYSANGSDYINIGYENADNYPSHNRGTWDGASWSTTTSDFLFHMKYTIDWGNKAFLLDANDLQKCNFRGLTESDVAADETLAAQGNSLVNTAFGGTLTGSKKYYASTTPGSVTPTPTMAADTCYIPLGESTSTSNLIIQGGIKRFFKEFNRFDLNASTGSKSTDFFVLTGFRPNKVRLQWNKVEDATDNDGAKVERTFVGTFDVGGLVINLLDGTGTIVGSTSTASYNADLSGLIDNKITITALHDNGVTMRVTQTDATEDIYTVLLTAEE